MPACGQTLSPRDVDALVAHVLTLMPPQDRASSALVDPWLTRVGLQRVPEPRQAPGLDLCDMAQVPSTLAERRGRLVLLFFWDTGCAPCLSKLSQLEEVAAEFHDRGVEVLPVCVNEGDVAPVRGVAQKYLHSLKLYIDPGGTARLRYGVDATPKACLIDRRGRLIAQGPGPRDWTDSCVREWLQACLATDADLPRP
jgi:peroxiredoxin